MWGNGLRRDISKKVSVDPNVWCDGKVFYGSLIAHLEEGGVNANLNQSVLFESPKITGFKEGVYFCIKFKEPMSFNGDRIPVKIKCKATGKDTEENQEAVDELDTLISEYKPPEEGGAQVIF